MDNSNKTVQSSDLFYNTEVTNKRVLEIWWSLAWRGVVFGYGAVFIVAFIFAFIAILLGIDTSTIHTLSSGIGYILGIFMALWILRNVLKKKFSSFRIILDNTMQSSDLSDSTEITYKQVLEIWWSLVWRNILFGFGAVFILAFIITLIGALIGMDKPTISILTTVIGLITGIFIALWVLKNVLKKKFSSFQIILTNEGMVDKKKPSDVVSQDNSFG